MIRRVLLFRNLIDNIPKNIGLYSVGIMFLYLYRVPIEVVSIVIGLLAFLVSYSSIYVLNDLFDVEDDKKDQKKVLRKPIAQGVVNKNEAVKVFILLLALGLLLSIFLNLLFFCVVCSLVFINMIYSIPLTRITNQSLEEMSPRSLKHTILGPPLVLLMQLLKIFLPWTISTEVMRFPVLFAVGFSFIYVILFKGYKEYRTIGESVKQTPFSFGIAVAFFASSMSMYPEPLVQALIVLYIFAGIVFFRNSHLTDRRVLLLSPIYILLGIIVLFYVITSM
ncbi:MAG: UbiA family prenyltransferase [Candidatus Thorarchaeota archaeon]|jgi:4-hydroxybenzoate polyprenyltransferase